MVVRAIAHGIVRLISSAIGFVMPLLMMSSYISPFGVAPVGGSFLPAAAMGGLAPTGSNATSSMLGSSGIGNTIASLASTYSFANPLDGILGPQLATSSFAQAIPFPIAAGSGFFVYMIITQILGRLQSITAPRPKSYSSAMGSSYGSGFPNPGFQPSATAKVPVNLPSDITKSQFMVLQSVHQGIAKPKEIAKHLSLDKAEAEREVNALKANGYITRNGKLTSKAAELLSS